TGTRSPTRARRRQARSRTGRTRVSTSGVGVREKCHRMLRGDWLSSRHRGDVSIDNRALAFQKLQTHPAGDALLRDVDERIERGSDGREPVTAIDDGEVLVAD